MSFLLKRYEVTVSDFPPQIYHASSRSKARAAAWNHFTDAYDCKFKDFIGICRVGCGRCKWKTMKRAAQRKTQERLAIETFKAEVLKRFPDAELCDNEHGGYRANHHAYVTREKGAWHWGQVVVSFKFPGMKIAPAHYGRNEPLHQWREPFIGPVKPEYTCCNGDREAFEQWASATRRTS